MKNATLCVTVPIWLSIAAGAWAQNQGPTLGTVELRWRERSTAGYNGSYTLGPGAVAGVDMVPTPDPSAASVTAQDASVVLVLEAKVTQRAGIAGNPIRGLSSMGFAVETNQVSGGAFARQVFATPGAPETGLRPNARVNATNLGFDPTALAGYPGGAARGVVSPFRAGVDSTIAGMNGITIGVVQPNLNRVINITPGTQIDLLSPGNPDATNPGEYGLAGLDTWVPVYVMVYTITDVTTPRDIVFSFKKPQMWNAPEYPEYFFRTWRGARNPDYANSDTWRLDPGFVTPPTFTVHVVPGPGAFGLIGVGACAFMRRRR